MSSYDTDNVFAKILRGEMPSHKIYEDEDVFVMLDIFPQARGHTLVVPKTPSRNLLDADPGTLSAIMPKIQKVALAVKAATSADGIRFTQFNEAPAGQSVFHLHFHLVPAYADVERSGARSARADDAELATLAEAIASKLAP